MHSLLVLLVSMSRPSMALDVFIIDDGDPNTAVLMAGLGGRGHTVTNSTDVDDGFTEGEFDGDEVDLSTFDAVIWLDGYVDVLSDMPESGQRALVDYVDGGGGLLVFGSSGYQYAAFDYNAHAADLLPLRSDVLGEADATIICLDDGHRVAAGWSLDEETVVGSGGIVVEDAVFGDVIFGVLGGDVTYDGVVASELGDGRSVQYAFFGNAPAVGALYETDWADDGISELVSNGLEWVVQRPPVVELPASWTVAAEDSRTLSPTSAYDPDGGSVTLSWDVGADGSADGTGDSFDFSAAGYDGPTEETVELTVTDDEGESSMATATVSITNVAPVIDTTPSPDVIDEGSDQELTLSFTDVEAADTHVVSWDFGDGETAEGNPVTHAWADEGRYTVTVSVADDDGATDSVVFHQSVTNVAPVLSGDPEPTATRGALWSFMPTVEDPGVDDVLSFDGTWPPDAELDPETGTLTWTPDADAVGMDHSFVLTVSDGDGGEDTLRWTVSVELDDADGDGMSDEWESGFGLDPGDPDDAAGDPDGDGRTNLDEYNGGSDPTTYEGPSQPTLISPIGDEEVADPTPMLTVGNAEAPLGQSVTYSFFVYSDAELTDLVASVTGRRGGSAGETTWSITGVALTENADYWWTASAADDYVETAPVDPAESFFVNVVNEAPETPELATPFDGGIAESLTPQLVLYESTDPDRDPLSYTVVLRDEEGAELVRGEGIEGDGTTAAWVSEVVLSDETTYCWTAWAVDDEGLQSEPASEACFFVDLKNDPPTAPTILEPEDDGLVQTLSPTITVQDGVDPEGRATIQEFQVDVDDNFDSELLQMGQVDSDDDGTSSWVPPEPLTEDTRWYLRVRCNDGGAASDWVSSSFLVSAENAAPSIPALLWPATGDEVEPAPGLTVANATDPEGRGVSYDFEVRERGGAVVSAATGVAEGADGQTTWTSEALEPGVYTWSSRSVDEDGGASEWAQPAVFAVVGGDSTTPSGDDTADASAWEAPVIAGEGCSCSSRPGQPRGWSALVVVVGTLAGAWRRRRGVSTRSG